MGISLFLAKVMGIWFLVDGLVALIRRKEIIPAVDELKNHRVTVMIMGSIFFVLGLTIVTVHNVWSGSAFQIVITLVGWAMMIKALVVSIMPHEFTSNLITKYNKEKIYILGGFVWVIGGLWLAISGFIL
jgi:hypothetical protein